MMNGALKCCPPSTAAALCRTAFPHEVLLRLYMPFPCFKSLCHRIQGLSNCGVGR